MDKTLEAPWAATVEQENGFKILHEVRICRVAHCPRPVARGLWHLYSTSGLPLGDSFAKLQNADLFPDWAYLVVEMCAEGWRSNRIESFIAQEIEGVYQPNVASKIWNGLHKLCEERVPA